MKIGIVGYGIVGKATHKGIISTEHTVVCHDPVLGTDQSILYDCDIVFICVPTDNYNDVDNVKRICGYLHQNSSCEIVIRCTVPPGTTESINQALGSNVMFMPEFLRERYWMEDCTRSLVLLGDDSNEKRAVENLRSDLIRVKTVEAEMVKLMNNVFATVNIVFANHMYDWCSDSNANYNKVLDLFHMFRNGQNYLECNADLRGFGGKCLPPNLEFAIEEFAKRNISQEFFTAIQKDNAKWPTTVRKDT